MTAPTPGPATNSGRGAGRERPPPGMVAGAEQEYHRMRGDLDQFTTVVRALLDSGWTDFEAVTDVYQTLRTQQPGATLLGTIALVRLAKTPAPPLGQPDKQP
jgi:hypothetical protein